MSDELYLIAHVVRGEPAFDIAIKLQIGDEEGWIIPTSGHRAYPYFKVSLEDACENLADLSKTATGTFQPPPCPPDWPDHYAANDRKRIQAIEEDTLLAHEAAPPGTGLFTNLAERLGLLPKGKITRR